MICLKSTLTALSLLFVSSAAAEAASKEFICDGIISHGDQTSSQTVYFSLALHGSWMFWAVDDGDGYFEIPGSYSTSLTGIDYLDGKFFLYKTGLGRDRGVPDGIFSKLSEYLEFRVGKNVFFEGNCRENA